MMIFYNKRSTLRFSQTRERMMLYYFTTLLYHYLMRLAVDAHHVDAGHGHRDAVRLSAVKQRATYAVDLNHRIGNNPASDVRNASCTATPTTIQHPTSATRTRFQCSHPKQADLCMEKESHRITCGILCS